MTQQEINNTFIKFMKSNSIQYEMNGEAYYAEWLEVSAGELGITPEYVEAFGSLEHVATTFIVNNDSLKSQGYDLFKILA